MRDGDLMAGLHGEERIVGPFGFGAENADGPMEILGDGGAAGQQAAAAHRGDESVEVAGLLEQFESRGALAGHDHRVIEGWNDGGAGLFDEGGGNLDRKSV